MDDLRIFMYDTNIDILAINETKLDNSILNNEVHLDGYEIIRKDRYTNGRNGGGVCIYVHNNLNYRIRNDLMNENLEFLMIEISKLRSKPFQLGTWYRLPNSQRKLLNLFEDSIERIDTENSELYLLGDCNLLSHDHDTNSFRSRRYFEFVRSDTINYGTN